MAIEYDLKAVEAKLKSLRSKREKLLYLGAYLFTVRKQKAEFVATDKIKLKRLISRTKADYQKYNAEFESGKLIYFSGTKRDETTYKRLNFKNIPLLRERLKLENTLALIEGNILLFKGLLDRVKNEPEESSSIIANPMKSAYEIDSTSLRRKLSCKQIALIHIYEKWQITRKNADEIAAQYGFTSKTSGEALFQDFTALSSQGERKSKPHPCTPKKLLNKINLFEGTLEHLSQNAKKWALDEIKILNTYYETEYL